MKTLTSSSRAFIDKRLIPEVNKMGDRGMPLPIGNLVKLHKPELRLQKNCIEISTDWKSEEDERRSEED